MSGVKVSGAVKGSKKLYAKIESIKSDLIDSQIDAVRDSTLTVHRVAGELIQDNSSGVPQVRYYRSGRKRTVLASKPGKPPNTDTGRLVQSIQFDFKNGGLTGRVGTDLKYGRALEFGTSKMEARPWLSTAVRLSEKEIVKIFRNAVKKEAKGNK